MAPRRPRVYRGGMATLEPGSYLAHLRTESARFRDVLADTDPGARVPTCPEWDAADLLWHLAEVQHFWEHIIRTRPADPVSSGATEPQRPAGHTELLAFFDDRHAALCATLEAADPGEPAWSWSTDPEDQRVAFTHRRQAHEALIHRRDAELTAGTISPFDPLLAADGVQEVLAVMYGGRPPWGSFDPAGRDVELRMEDGTDPVRVELGTLSGTAPDGAVYADEQDLRVVPAPGTPADLVIAGDAEDVDAWLWHRADGGGLTVTGDDAAYAHLRAVLAQPIQ